MSEHQFRNFTHLTIPAEIWLRRDISMQSKCLWAELRSLHDSSKGGCYASDEYLCDFLQLKRRRLYELYKELKEAGLMEVVSFDGRKTIRRALVPEVEYVRAQQVCGIVHSSSAENCTPQVQNPALAPYIDNKEDNKDKNIARTTASPRQEAPDISFSFEQKKFLHIKDSDIQGWKEVYAGIDIVREMRLMVEWCLSNPKKAKNKKQWRKFITTWLQNSFERATNREAIRGQKQKSVIDDHKVNEKYWGGKPAAGGGKRKVLDFSEET